MAKPMSTMADSWNGFDSTSCSVLFPAVKPSARYHAADVDVAHGATDVPAGWIAALLDDAAAAGDLDDGAAYGRRRPRRRRRSRDALERRHHDALLDLLAGTGEQGDPDVELDVAGVGDEDLAAGALLPRGRAHRGRTSWS